jgi:hypothetical protein
LAINLYGGFSFVAVHTAMTELIIRQHGMTRPRTFTVAAFTLFLLLVTGYSGAQTVRYTTWNLQWFPNGSVTETSTAQQEQRIVQPTIIQTNASDHSPMTRNFRLR